MKLERCQKIGIFCLVASVAGLIGWIYEMVFYYFDGGMKQVYMQGGNFLPWINIYAIGAVFIVASTYKFKDKPLMVFILSLLSTGLLEFLSGLILFRVFNVRYWDYNVEILNFGNIGGYICLRSVLLFGLSGLYLVYFLVPYFTKLSTKVNKKKFLIVSITILAIILLDEFYNLFAGSFNLPTAKDFYKSIGFKYM